MWLGAGELRGGTREYVEFRGDMYAYTFHQPCVALVTEAKVRRAGRGP